MKWIKTVFMIFFFFLVFSSPVLAQKMPCYVIVEKYGNFDHRIVVNSSISLISQFIEKVQMPPIGGVRDKDCSYRVNLSESMQGFIVSITGSKVNSIGDSRTPGTGGLTIALLRAIYRTKNTDEIKTAVCNNYSTLMQDDCKPIEAEIAFYNARGKVIRENSTVREGDEFNVMLQSSNSLYAYIVNKDSAGNLFRIFPNKEVTNYKNPLRSGFPYFFPPKDSELIFSFDDTRGEELFYFIFSKSPLDDLDVLFAQLEKEENNTKKTKKIGALVEKQIKTRGIGLKKKKKKTKQNSSTKNQLPGAENLVGQGGFVKIVSLHHM